MGLILSRSVYGLPRQKYSLEVRIDSDAEVETPLDPTLSIIDPHHHLWDARIHDKGWPVSPTVIRILYKLNPRLLVPLMRADQDARVSRFVTKFMWAAVPYMENEMTRDIENLPQSDRPIGKEEREGRPGGHNVVGTVYVESGWDDPNAPSRAFKGVPEAAMAQGVAKSTSNRLCTGIVAHVPLDEGAEAVRPALRKLVDAYPNVRGIRNEVAYREGMFPLTTKPRLLADAKFRSGFGVLKEYGLVFDTWLYHDQISELRDLALDFPDVAIVCDHVGYPVGWDPYDRSKAFEEWKVNIADLANQCPNVVVKLSGLGSAVVGFGYEDRKVPPNSQELADDWGPYIRHCVSCFGFDRCMFASNFPVDKTACTYTACWNAYKRVANEYGEEERRKLFHDTAARVYRLEV